MPASGWGGRFGAGHCLLLDHLGWGRPILTSQFRVLAKAKFNFFGGNENMKSFSFVGSFHRFIQIICLSTLDGSWMTLVILPESMHLSLPGLKTADVFKPSYSPGLAFHFLECFPFSLKAYDRCFVVC